MDSTCLVSNQKLASKQCEENRQSLAVFLLHSLIFSPSASTEPQRVLLDEDVMRLNNVSCFIFYLFCFLNSEPFPSENESMNKFEDTRLHKDLLVFTSCISDPASDIINLWASSQVKPQTLTESHYKVEPAQTSRRRCALLRWFDMCSCVCVILNCWAPIKSTIQITRLSHAFLGQSTKHKSFSQHKSVFVLSLSMEIFFLQFLKACFSKVIIVHAISPRKSMVMKH